MPIGRKRDYYEGTLDWFRKHRLLGPSIAIIVATLAFIGPITQAIDGLFNLQDRWRPLELVSVELTTTDPVILDFKVQNRSSSVKVLHKLVLRILEVSPGFDQACLERSLAKALLPSARYRIEITPEKWQEGAEVSIAISHEVEPNEADRFEVQLASPETVMSIEKNPLFLPKAPNSIGSGTRVQPLPAPKVIADESPRTTIQAIIVYGRDSHIVSDPIDIIFSCP